MMKKLFIYFFSIVIYLFTLLYPSKIEAAADCQFNTSPPSPIPFTARKFYLIFDTSPLQSELLKKPPGGKLEWSFPGTLCGNDLITVYKGKNSIPPNVFFTIDASNVIGSFGYCTSELTLRGTHRVGIIYEYTRNNKTVKDVVCAYKTYTRRGSVSSCDLGVSVDGIGDVASKWKFTIKDINSEELTEPQRNLSLRITLDGQEIATRVYNKGQADPEITVEQLDATQHRFRVTNLFESSETMCEYTWTVAEEGVPLTPVPIPTSPPECKKITNPASSCRSDKFSGCPQCKNLIRATTPAIVAPTLTELCNQLTNEKRPGGRKTYRELCRDCIDQKNKVWTAVGCIPITYTKVVNLVLGWGTGIAGGVAFLYFLYGAFLILTSSGNAEKMEEAKQIIMSSLSGLLLIIFSIFLLQVIGVDILQIPGFTK